MPICVSDVCTLRLVGGFGCCHIALYKWIDGWENRQEKSDRILSHLGSVKCKLKRQQHLCEHDGSLSWPQAACHTMEPFLFWCHISIWITFWRAVVLRSLCSCSCVYVGAGVESTAELIWTSVAPAPTFKTRTELRALPVDFLARQLNPVLKGQF